MDIVHLLVMVNVFAIKLKISNNVKLNSIQLKILTHRFIFIMN